MYSVVTLIFSEIVRRTVRQVSDYQRILHGSKQHNLPLLDSTTVTTVSIGNYDRSNDDDEVARARLDRISDRL